MSHGGRESKMSTQIPQNDPNPMKNATAVDTPAGSTRDHQDDKIACKDTGEDTFAEPPEDPFQQGRDETISLFLARVKPSRMKIEKIKKIRVLNRVEPHEILEEPKEEFLEMGKHILQEFDKMAAIAKYSAAHDSGDEEPGWKFREINPQYRSEIKERIVQMAKRLGVREGKWIFTIDQEDGDEAWSKIAMSTSQNQLGHYASIQLPSSNLRSVRASKRMTICIHTKDFDDMNDVVRVFREIRNLGLFKLGSLGRKIYYKPHAFTYLSLYPDNDYTKSVSLYDTIDVEIWEERHAGKA